MPRRKTPEIAEPAEPMTPAYILPDNVKREIPVSKIVITGMVLPSYVEIAHAHLFSLRHGDRTWIPKVFPRENGTYGVVHFSVA